jgi:uncharacterized protein YeaO (DUF488 family)
MGDILKKINDSIESKNFDEFNHAYQQLLKNAEPHKLSSIRNVLAVHNQITHGASERILQEHSLDLNHFQINETMFKVFLSRLEEHS